MDYREMIEEYAKKGGSEAKMWESVEITAEAMEYIKDTNPEKYECLMRKLSEAFYGKHYSEELAHIDVAKLRYTDAAGNKKAGAHWTMEEILAATADMSFPKATTNGDLFVAFNASYADFCKDFDDAQVLKIAYDFWFDDEDWKSEGKIWDYMSLNR